MRRWLAVRTFTLLSGQVQLCAVGWAVYAVTGDPLDLAWLGLAQFVPVLLLVLPAGQVADRVDRRLVLSASWLAQALVCLAFWARVDALDSWTVAGLGLAMGTVRAFANPAGQALLSSLVPPEELPRALALSSGQWQLTTVIGPSVGGALIAVAGPGVALTSAAAGYLIAAVLALGLPAVVLPPVAFGWDHVFGGVRYVRANRLLLACTTLDLFAVLLGGATALLPIFATDLLQVGPVGFGLLRAAPAVGAALVAARLSVRPLVRRAGPTLLGAVAVFGVCTLIFAFSRSFPLSLGALAVLGAADMVSVFIRQTLVQLRTPDAMRGRVSAVNQVFIGASNELGDFESGLLAAWLGASSAAAIGGIGTLFVVAVWALGFRELREADALHGPA
jgi:MFS family permease